MGIGQALHRAGTASLYQLMSRSYKDPHFIKQKRIYLVVQSVASRISEQKLVWPFAVRHKWLSGMDFLLSSKNQAVGSTKTAWKRPVTKVVPRVLLRASWSKDLIAAGLLRFFQITYTQQCNFFSKSLSCPNLFLHILLIGWVWHFARERKITSIGQHCTNLNTGLWHKETVWNSVQQPWNMWTWNIHLGSTEYPRHYISWL